MTQTVAPERSGQRGAVSMVFVSEADWRVAGTPFLASVREEVRGA
jgi:hypothetical protein